MLYYQELFRLFITEEHRLAILEKRPPIKFTLENFTKWASSNLRSPSAVWLYSISFSIGAYCIVLRSASR